MACVILRSKSLGALLAAAALVVVVASPALGQGAEPRAPKREAPKEIAPGEKCAKCHAELAGGKGSVHGPVREEQCDVCHEQSGGKHEFKLMAEKTKLCAECHDLKHAAKVHKPVAEGRCLSCHDAHSASEPKLLRAPLAELCAGCHGKKAKASMPFVHGPFGAGACEACHQPHSSPNAALLVKDGAALCLECHDQMSPPPGVAAPVWHSPVKDDCSVCHSGHQSEVRRQLVKAVPELCLECHDSIENELKAAKVPHKAIGLEGSCTNCHLPHVGRFASLLKQEPAELCLSCHGKEYPQPKGRPLADFVKLLKEAPDHHGPIRDRNCSGCHKPHGSKEFRLLKFAYPADFYAPFDAERYALCFSCHPKALALEERSSATGFRDGERNLHFLHVNREKGRSCRACHETHASEKPRHIRETTPFGKWDMPVRFEKTATGGGCKVACHTPQQYDREKPVKPRPGAAAAPLPASQPAGKVGR